MSRNPADGVRFKSKFSQKHKKNNIVQQDKYHKVIGNRSEGQGYADKRKRKVLNQYRRDRKKLLHAAASAEVGFKSSPIAVNTTTGARGSHGSRFKDPRGSQGSKFKATSSEEATLDLQSHGGVIHKRQSQSKKNRFWQAEQSHKQKAAEQQKKKEEYQANKAKQEEALKKYREKKSARHKKLSRKTPRGQPVMRYQIEDLLDKLKKE